MLHRRSTPEGHVAVSSEELRSLIRGALHMSSPGLPRQTYLARAGVLTAGELRNADIALGLVEESLKDLRSQLAAGGQTS
jgi:hypothetical protein